MRASEALEVVRVAVRDASGLPDACVVWQERPGPFADVVVRLNPIDWTDEVDSRLVEEETSTTISRHVGFTTSCRVESLAHVRENDAVEVAHRVISDLEFPSIREAAIASGVTPLGALGFSQTATTIDGRRLSVVLFDLEWRAELHSTRHEVGGVIEHIELEGTLENGPENITTEIEV